MAPELTELREDADVRERLARHLGPRSSVTAVAFGVPPSADAYRRAREAFDKTLEDRC